jgi:hypothetical protein
MGDLKELSQVAAHSEGDAAVANTTNEWLCMDKPRMYEWVSIGCRPVRGVHAHVAVSAILNSGTLGVSQ